MRNHDKSSSENHLPRRTGVKRVRIDLMIGIAASFVCLLCLVFAVMSDHDSPKIVPNTAPNATIGMTPIDSTGARDPMQDPVNQGNADVGGERNLPTDGRGAYDPNPDERKDHPEESGITDGIQEHESSGMGRGHKDQVITGPGNVDNGVPAPRDPILVNPNSAVTDSNTGISAPVMGERNTSSATASDTETASVSHPE